MSQCINLKTNQLIKSAVLSEVVKLLDVIALTANFHSYYCTSNFYLTDQFAILVGKFRVAIHDNIVTI